MNQSFDLSSVLTGLLYGREAAEPLEQTLDRLIAPNFVLRMNGQVYDRSGFAAAYPLGLHKNFVGGVFGLLVVLVVLNLTAGMSVDIPAGKAHRFENAGQGPLELVAVRFR